MLWSLALVPIVAGLALAWLRVERRAGLAVIACAALALTLLLALWAAIDGWQATLHWSRLLRLRAELVPVSATVAVLVPAVALPVLLYATGHEGASGLRRLVALLLVFVGAMELLVVAADLVTLLVGWELVGACSWALIGHRWRSREATASGIYAFLATRLGDLGLFVAALAAFAGAGSFDYADLARLDAPTLHLVTAGVLLSAAAKSGQVPFSPWLFRAMDGPTSVSALLHAATMVAAGAYLLARLQPQLADVGWFGPATIAIGLATALAGGVVAMLQPHAKKLLAASTSAHFGLMFVAVGAGWPGVALLHLVAHACFKAPLFLAAGVAGERSGGYGLAGMRLGRALPAMAVASAVAALALAGVPPLGAAWTKETVVAATGERGPWLAAGVMLAGGLSAAYAARFQLLAFGRSGGSHGAPAPASAERIAVGLLAFACLALSVLWLPAVREAAMTMLAVRVPPSGTTEFVLSVLVVALGLAAGRVVVVQRPALGTAGAAAAAADWLGLPGLLQVAVVRPAAALARALAWVDDTLLDAVPRAIGSGARGVAGLMASGDRYVVDRGVAASAALARWLAGTWSRFGEAIADGLPEGGGRLVAMGGRDAVRLQTGLSHHYYVLIAVGAALVAAILLLGS